MMEKEVSPYFKMWDTLEIQITLSLVKQNVSQNEEGSHESEKKRERTNPKVEL